MKSTPLLLLLLVFAVSSPLGFAVEQVDHKAHHPAKTQATKPPTNAVKMAMMDDHMKTMREMHEKMKAAKNDEERQTLMREHKEKMHESMAAMHGGQHGKMAEQQSMSPQMMQKKMAMMEMMMHIMMEHMAPSGSAAKPEADSTPTK